MLVVDTATSEDDHTSIIEIFVLSEFEITVHDIFIVELSREQGNSGSNHIRSDDRGGNNENDFVQDESQNATDEGADNLSGIKVGVAIGRASKHSVEDSSVEDITSDKTQSSSDKEDGNFSELVSSVTKTKTQDEAEQGENPENRLGGGDGNLRVEEHARTSETNNSGNGKDGELDQLETKEVEKGTEDDQNGTENVLVVLDEFNEEVSRAGASIKGFTSDSVNGAGAIGGEDRSAEFGSGDSSGILVTLKNNNELLGGVVSRILTDVDSRVGDLETFGGVGAVDQIEGGVGLRNVVAFAIQGLIGGIDFLGTIATEDMVISDTESDVFSGKGGDSEVDVLLGVGAKIPGVEARESDTAFKGNSR
jgi:hypothetical protein